jgi:hypothetical protein
LCRACSEYCLDDHSDIPTGIGANSRLVTGNVPLVDSAFPISALIRTLSRLACCEGSSSHVRGRPVRLEDWYQAQ